MDKQKLLSAELEARLEFLRRYVTDLWASGDPINPFFTLHGPQHLSQVEKIVGHIFAPEHRGRGNDALAKIVTPEQMFYLLAAVWLHDVGMIVPLSAEERASPNNAGLSVSDWVREQHHTRSAEYILHHSEDLRLSSQEAGFIAVISAAHRAVPLSGGESAVSSSYPDTQFLAAVLRIADELDITTARAPEQLLRMRWEEMDVRSQWHWLKHWCVSKAEPHHIEDVETRQRSILLTYQIVLRLPSRDYEVLFLSRVLEPIRRALVEEHVELILMGKGLGVDPGRFRCCVQFVNPSFPDGTFLAHRLGDELLGRRDARERAAAVMEALRSRMPRVLFDMVLNRLEFAFEIGFREDRVRDVLESKFSAVVCELCEARDVDGVERAIECASVGLKELVGTGDSQVGRVMTLRMERTALEMGLICVQLLRHSVLMFQGDEAMRLQQLNHILQWLGAEANAVAEWGYENIVDESFQETCVAHIARFVGGGGVSVLDKASRHPNERIRAAAAVGLGKYGGPMAIERVGQILGGDVSGEVRRAARESMARCLDGARGADGSFAGKRVLLCSDEAYVVPPLVDELERRGIEVVVRTQIDAIMSYVKTTKVDVIVWPMTGDEWDGKDGLNAAKGLRDIVTGSCSFVVYGAGDSGNFATDLRALEAVYCPEPVTWERLARCIESVIGRAGRM